MRAGFLWFIRSLIWQFLLNNLPADEEKTTASRNVVIKKDNENFPNGAIMRHRSLKENGNRRNLYTQNLRKTDEIT